MKNNLIDLYRAYVRCADMCSEYNEKHKTNIQPRDCVQLKYATGEWVGYFSLNEPNFSELLDHKIRFAVAIIEGRPVFVGDIMFEKTTGDKVLISGINLHLIDFARFTLEPPQKPRREISDPMRWAEGLIEQLPDTHEGALSWLMYHGDGDKSDSIRKEFNFKKPRTFALNGVELPCPIRNQNGYILRINDHPDGHIFMFKTLEQRDTVRDAILSVLEQASRKE